MKLAEIHIHNWLAFGANMIEKCQLQPDDCKNTNMALIRLIWQIQS